MINRLLKWLMRSVLIKNQVTLWLKLFADVHFGRSSFLTHGKHVRPTERVSAQSPKAKRVLFPTAFFLDRGLAWQVTVAKALAVRGDEITFMPLDLRFPKCNALYFDEPDHWGFMNSFYKHYTRALLENFKLPIKPYSKFGSSAKFHEVRRRVSKFDEEACRQYVIDGIPIGRLALNPLIHYFRCSAMSVDRPRILEAYRDFLAQGTILKEIIERALDAIRPDAMFLLNGTFLDSSLQFTLARARGIRVVTFEAGFRLNTILLGENEPIISFPMVRYLPKTYDSYSLSKVQEDELDRYLETRSYGKDNVFDYWGKPKFDHDSIRQELGLRSDAVPDILFTNLLWDSAMLDCDIAFRDQLDWITETIRFYISHPDRCLIVRIHPAEVTPASLESQDKVEPALRKIFPTLPNNVIIIPPTSTISSYPLTKLSNASLVYSSTAGLESAIMGKPAIIAGKTHYRGQGFTHDISKKSQYFQLLEHPTLPAEAATVIARARKYAYFFFFGYMIPFDLVTELPAGAGTPVRFNYESEDLLLPGANDGLDFTINLIHGLTNYQERLTQLIQ